MYADDAGPEFDTYRGAVLQIIRDAGYAATAAIGLVRRFQQEIREAWIEGWNVEPVARVVISLAEEAAASDRTPLYQPTAE